MELENSYDKSGIGKRITLKNEKQRNNKQTGIGGNLEWN